MLVRARLRHGTFDRDVDDLSRYGAMLQSFKQLLDLWIQFWFPASVRVAKFPTSVPIHSRGDALFASPKRHAISVCVPMTICVVILFVSLLGYDVAVCGKSPIAACIESPP